MPATKHVPIRTCAVCRQKDGKRALTRVVRTEEGVLVDTSGKRNGRGAYICDNPACWQRATTSDILQGALRVVLTPADRERLRQHTP